MGKNINQIEFKDGVFRIKETPQEIVDINLERIKKKLLKDIDAVSNATNQEPAPSEVTVTVNIY